MSRVINKGKSDPLRTKKSVNSANQSRCDMDLPAASY